MPLDVCPRATPALRRVARELHAIDGEHLAAEEPLGVADRDHRGEHPRDVLAERAHEVGNRREVRRGVPTQRDERDVVATALFDPPAAHDTVGAPDEHHLEEHRGRGRRSARGIIAKAGIEVREINGVIEQVIDCVLEGPE